MKKYFTAFLFLFLFTKIVNAQTATFITLDNNGNLYRVTISSAGCNYTPLTFCTASMGGNLPLSIALNGTTLYTVDNKGNIYSATLGAANCSKIGAFAFNTASKNTIYGLTVDKNGLLYAASGGEISTFNPTTSVLTKLPGKLPSGYAVGGDIIFYLGQLYMPTKTDELIQVNLANLATSTVYLNFSSPQIFGISSVSVPCSNNQVYALSTPSGSGTTDIIALDMQNKAEGGDICQLPFETYDAASIAESGVYVPPNLITHDQSICAPGTIDLTAPAVTAGSTSDIVSLSYWKNALATVPYTTPTMATNGTYYIKGATVSGCADTNKVVVTVNALPVISIQPSTTAQTVCKNGNVSSLNITASAGSGSITGYQWYSNSSAAASGGTLIPSATSSSYTPSSITIGTLYYYCIVTNSNGCSTTSNISGAINIVAKPNAGNDQPLCLNKTATMAAVGTGSWSQFPANPTIASITTPSANNTTITGFTAAGNYIFIWGNGTCNDTTQVNVISVARSTIKLTICETQLPYTWNGKIFTTAGTDSVQLVSSVNCDSVATLILTATPTARSTTKLTICETQLPYTWNSTVFSSAKTDSVKLVSAANCDSVATLILTATPTARSTIKLTICENQLPYTWNSKVFATAKTDSAKLVSAANCDSMATLILTVTPIARSITNITICPAQLPYTWNGKVFTGAKEDSVKLVSAANCDSMATLILDVNSTVRSTTKLTLCETQLPYTWNSIVFSSAKTDSIKLTSSANCDSIAILILTVNPTKRSSTKLTICQTQLPYTWNSIIFTIAKTDSAKLISAANCDSIATLILSVTPIVRSTTKQTICETQLPYTWNSLVFTAAKTDSVKLVSSANCDSIATLILTVTSTVRSITKQTICEKQLPYTWNGKIFSAAKTDSVKLISIANCDSVATLILTVPPTTRSITNLTICPAQLPYTWNGKIFATAKTDSVQLASAANCDSIATLILTVTPTVRSTTKQTICQTQLPYTWNSKVFTTAKTDSVQFTSSANCDSVAILILTVIPTARSSTKQTICQTQLPYTWNGKTFTNAATDSVKLVSSANCDSIATLVLTVTPTVRSITNLTLCATALPFTWNNKVFTTAKTDSVKLVSSANCDSIATLILTVTPTVRSTTNLTICETALPFTWNNKVFANAKTDSVRLTSSINCDSIATLVLTVSPTVRSITYTTICPIDLPYHWNDQLFTAAKTDSVHLISNSHCDSVATLVLTVTPTVRSTTRQTICETQLPFTWNNKVFTTAKTDSVRFNSSAGCDSMAILILNVTSVTTPVTDFSYSPNAICIGGINPTLINATGFTSGGQYSATPAGLTINKNTGAITVSTSLPNTYTITYNVAAGSCSNQKSSISTFTINSAIIPVTSFSYNTPVCNTSNTLSPILAAGFTTGGIFTSTPGLSIDETSGAINLFSSIPDKYTVTYTIVPTSCIVKGSHTNPVTIDASSNNSITIDACSSYTWNDITYTSSGIYVQNFINTAGCDSIVTLHLTVVPNCFGTNIYFPSAFSPNGDGVNDYFGPLGNPTLVKNYLLRIYNRFGELVFHSTNPYAKWDGSYLGAITAPNNYVWYADFLLSGKPTTMKGNLILIK